MSLQSEASILVNLASLGSLDKEQVVLWADFHIGSIDSPPFWLIDLSTLGFSRLVDYLTILREHADEEALSRDSRLAFIIGAHIRKFVSLPKAMSALWELWSGPDFDYDSTGIPENILNLLADWDCLDDLDKPSKSFMRRSQKVFQKIFDERKSEVEALELLLNKMANKTLHSTADRT